MAFLLLTGQEEGCFGPQMLPALLRFPLPPKIYSLAFSLLPRRASVAVLTIIMFLEDS